MLLRFVIDLHDSRQSEFGSSHQGFKTLFVGFIQNFCPLSVYFLNMKNKCGVQTLISHWQSFIQWSFFWMCRVWNCSHHTLECFSSSNCVCGTHFPQMSFMESITIVWHVRCFLPSRRCQDSRSGREFSRPKTEWSCHRTVYCICTVNECVNIVNNAQTDPPQCAEVEFAGSLK